VDTNWPAAFAALLQDEGGYVDNPSDPGGKTNLGVTAAVWRDWKRLPTMPSEFVIRSLTPRDVEPLYKLRYWGAVNGDRLPPGLDYAVFDYGVNSGPGQSARVLQRLLAITDDGKVGPGTLAAIVGFADMERLVALLCAARMGYLKALPGWETFGDGWSERIKRVEERALSMVSASHPG
jgi:lysozyme family protein